LRIQVPDREKEIRESIDFALNKSDVVFLIGGLGGTSDDITKEVVAKHFNRGLFLDEEILNKIKKYFESIGKKMPELNRKVAYVIEGGKTIENRIGFAPGIELNLGRKRIFLLPGMREEFIELVNRIFEEMKGEKKNTGTFKLFGITECDVQKKLEDLFTKEIKDYVFYYPSFKGLTIKIIAEKKEIFERVMDKFKDEFKEYIYSDDESEIEKVLGEKLKEKGFTIAVAESVTGGLISNLITDVPGSSEYFKGGVVSYSNEAKIDILNVKKKDIESFGAVSEDVAREMAEGVKEIFNADIGISTTGIAGPSGGSKEKPVGLVYIGCSIKDKTEVFRYVFKEPRLRIKMNASCAAIFNVIKRLE
jgi:nicotinamide-nucleotide amidase